MSNEGNKNKTTFIHTRTTTFENCKEVTIHTQNLRTLKSKRVTKYYRDGKIVSGQNRYIVEIFLADARGSEIVDVTEYK